MLSSLSTINNQQSTINNQQSTINNQQSTINNQHIHPVAFSLNKIVNCARNITAFDARTAT